ncbi:F0F1 ATP synthase subunit delta [Pigmentiphaga kullae]|uniref:ATP synthase subunit delta n=1 Tax=Pigmentiphaga kullae TaxID=151784 RepID=A0A4Q7NIN6_9BURK|nr:F0F1 ATP synthase subunit delta [Pigmentiphaga kullae]RZS84875.1 ATP synthase F1 subcomplex delta subunit [Pigmentiphaga kullae]
MAELSTIARPYAEALFGVARADSAGLAAWAELVAEMAQAAAHPEVRSAIADPKLDDAQRVELFTATLKTQLTPAARNFVTLLVENDRLLLLPEIASQFLWLKNRHEGTADAEIASAFALTDAQVADLVAGLEKKFGVKIKPTVRVDASLIGGVRVAVGDQVLDTSVRAQLDRMRDALVA